MFGGKTEMERKEEIILATLELASDRSSIWRLQRSLRDMCVHFYLRKKGVHSAFPDRDAPVHDHELDLLCRIRHVSAL